MGDLFRRYEGPIEVGDRFEWCPYGHEGWPKSWESIRVVAVSEHSGNICTRSLSQRHPDVWVEEDDFRDMVKKAD